LANHVAVAATKDRWFHGPKLVAEKNVGINRQQQFAVNDPVDRCWAEIQPTH
jgi:hypothetical protein